MDRTSFKSKEQKKFKFKFKFTRSHFRVLFSPFLNLKKLIPEELAQAGLLYKRVRKKIMKSPAFIKNFLDAGLYKLFLNGYLTTTVAIEVVSTLFADKDPTHSESFAQKKEALLKWCERDLALAQHVLSQEGWTVWITLEECAALLEKNHDLKEWMQAREDSIFKKKADDVKTLQNNSALDDLSTQPAAVETIAPESQALPSEMPTVPERTDAEIIQSELAGWNPLTELLGLFENHDDVKEWIKTHGSSIFQRKINDADISEHEKRVVLSLCKKNARLALRFLEENAWSRWFTPIQLLSVIELHPSLHEWFDAHRNEIILAENLGSLIPHELYVCASASEELAKHILVSEHFDKLTLKQRELLSKKYEGKCVYHLIEVMTTPARAINFITSRRYTSDDGTSDMPSSSVYGVLEMFKTTAAPFYKRLVGQVAESTELKWVSSSSFTQLLKLHPACLVEIFRYPQLLEHIPYDELEIAFRDFQSSDQSYLSYLQEFQMLLVAAYHEPTVKHPIYQLKDISIPSVVITDANTPHTTQSDKFAESFLGYGQGIHTAERIIERRLALEVLSSKTLASLLYPQDFKERCVSCLNIPSRAEYESLSEEAKKAITNGNHEILAAYSGYRKIIFNVKDIADAVRDNDPMLCLRIAELIQRPECSLEFLPEEYGPQLNKPKYWYDKAMLGLGNTFQACLPLAAFYQQQAEAEKNPETQKQLWRQVRELCMKAFELSPEVAQKNQAGLMLAKLYEDNQIEFSAAEIAEYEAETGESSLTSGNINENYAFEWHVRLLEYDCADSVIFFLKYWQLGPCYLELLQLSQRTIEMDFKLSETQHYEFYSALVVLLDTIYNHLPKDAHGQVALSVEHETALKAQVRALYDGCVRHGQAGGAGGSSFLKNNSEFGSPIKAWLGIENEIQASASKVPQPARTDDAELAEARLYYIEMYKKFTSTENNIEFEKERMHQIQKEKMHQELFSTGFVTKRFSKQ